MCERADEEVSVMNQGCGKADELADVGGCLGGFAGMDIVVAGAVGRDGSLGGAGDDCLLGGGVEGCEAAVEKERTSV